MSEIHGHALWQGPRMRTHGLDLSTTPSKSALVTLQWQDDHAHVAAIETRLGPPGIVDLLARSATEHVAVDVPFGWPDPFVALLQDRRDGPLTADRMPPADDWPTWRTSTMALRATDRWCAQETRIRPLPVSFQLLGATAAMWALIEGGLAQRGVMIDRSGASGMVCETYPRAALALWGHTLSLKPDLTALEALMPWLRLDDKHRRELDGSDDVRDALVCAVVARARACNLTELPPPEHLALAGREGWIHVSRSSLVDLARAR